jgi:RNA ligase (TIGR02306 family)
MTRKLVTLRKISALSSIPNADAIEVASVDGWKLVVKRGEFQVNDYCLYFEIDSFLPESDVRYSFLMKSVREFEGTRGHKLRTIKLRGQISQGLALPLSLFPELTPTENTDYSELLGIKKWEAVISASMAGVAKGSFPSFISKTDQERAQNLVDTIFEDQLDTVYEVSLKMDGSSCTIYYNNGQLGVCSRNLELKLTEENSTNAFVKAMYDANLHISLPALGKNIAIQGELMGPGIQGNREKLKSVDFFVFDMFNIDTGEYLTPLQRMYILAQLRVVSPNLNHVPILCNMSLSALGVSNVDELLKFAECPSLNHPIGEGLVFKSMDTSFSFKAISNKFLEKEKD